MMPSSSSACFKELTLLNSGCKPGSQCEKFGRVEYATQRTCAPQGFHVRAWWPRVQEVLTCKREVMRGFATIRCHGQPRRLQRSCSSAWRSAGASRFMTVPGRAHLCRPFMPLRCRGESTVLPALDLSR